MARSRSYTPDYNNNYEEIVAKITESLDKTGMYLMKNPQPYDLYSENGGVTSKHKTHHVTVFYRDIGLIGKLIPMMLDDGYSLQEQSNNTKSIPIPHIHFIRKLQPGQKTQTATT